jgi:hypothetical protein
MVHGKRFLVRGNSSVVLKKSYLVHGKRYLVVWTSPVGERYAPSIERRWTSMQESLPSMGRCLTTRDGYVRLTAWRARFPGTAPRPFAWPSPWTAEYQAPLERCPPLAVGHRPSLAERVRLAAAGPPAMEGGRRARAGGRRGPAGRRRSTERHRRLTAGGPPTTEGDLPSTSLCPLETAGSPLSTTGGPPSTTGGLPSTTGGPPSIVASPPPSAVWFPDMATLALHDPRSRKGRPAA